MPKDATKPKLTLRQRLTIARFIVLVVMLGVLIAGGIAGAVALDILHTNKLRDTAAILFLDMERLGSLIPSKMDELFGQRSSKNKPDGVYRRDGASGFARISGSVPERLQLYELGLKALPKVGTWTVVRVGDRLHLVQLSRSELRLWQTRVESWFSTRTGSKIETRIYLVTRDGLMVHSNTPEINQSTYAARPLVRAFIKKRFTNAQIELDDDSGGAYGFFYEIPRTNLVLFAETTKSDALASVRRLSLQYFGVLIAVLLVTLLVVRIPIGQIVRPIRELAHLAPMVGEGNFSALPQATGFGELVPLLSSFRKMAENLTTRDNAIKKLMRDREKQARMANELAIAKSIQDNFLCDIKLPTSAWVRIATRYEPAEEVAGDWYGFTYDQDSGEFIAAIVDVSGHGVGSAMFTAIIAAMFDDTRVASRSFDIERFLVLSNQRIYNLANHAVHATAQVVRFKPQTRELEIINAGHPPAILYTAESAGSEPKARSIRLPSSPLGLDAKPDLCKRVVPIRDPFSLLLYTDGLTEARSGPSAPLYGLKRLVRAVSAKPIPHSAPDALLAAVLQDWHGYIANEPPKDDVCVIAIGSAA